MDGYLDPDGILARANNYHAVSGSQEHGDVELLRACRRGQPGAWEELVRRYARLAYSVSRRYGLNDDELADVFQAVCMELWEHVDSIRDATVLSRWLMLVASRKSWQMRKGHDRWVRGLSDNSVEAIVSSMSVSPEDIAIANSDAEQARTMLERLSSPDRELIRYLFFDPACPSYQVIAERLDVSPDTIGSLRRNCLRRLRWVLTEHFV